MIAKRRKAVSGVLTRVAGRCARFSREIEEEIERREKQRYGCFMR